MDHYPYDASLEWVPREYQVDEKQDPRKERVGSSQQRYTGHIEYPNAPYPQPTRPAPQGQQRQSYASYQAAHAAPQSQYAAQPRQRQDRPAERGAAAASQRMSKADAMELADSLKRTLMVGAIIGFGVLSVFVATHAVGSSSGSSQSTPGLNSTGGNPNSPNTNNNNTNNGGFFNQQGGGNGFGSGGYSQPSSGTHVS